MFNEKKLEFLINLGSYKIKYVVLRVIIVSVTVIGLFYFIGSTTDEHEFGNTKREYIYLLGIIAFNSISEFNLLLMKVLNSYKKLRWNLYLQIIIVISVSISLAAFWINLAQKAIGEKENIILHQTTQMALLAGLSFIIIHLLVTIISNLIKEWMDNRKEIIELKQAKLQNDYNVLKDRLNPHFLFNNLSVLKSLIRYSPESAEIFTQNFTNVYRYVLKSNEQKTVSLHEELKFLESYIALHKERIGEGLNIFFNISPKLVQKQIPPMALQLLVENAIKHNVANKAYPLHIDIYSKLQSITVKNNLQKKNTTYSTHTGLELLRKQYLLLANKEILIVEDQSHYSITLPLI